MFLKKIEQSQVSVYNITKNIYEYKMIDKYSLVNNIYIPESVYEALLKVL